MSNLIQYQRALYYPYINFSNLNWLKTAALYYEGLSRIVPPGYTAFTDKKWVERMNDQEEFIKDIHPTAASLTAGLKFSKFIENEFSDPGKRNAYMQEIGASIPNEKPFVIHDLKLTNLIREQLLEGGFMYASKTPNSYDFEPITGAMYMTFLANEIAIKEYLPIVTDDPIFQPLIRGAQKDEISNEVKPQGEIGHMLASLLIESVVPVNIESVSIKKIMHFRKKHNAEQHQFYHAINELVQGLEVVDNSTALDMMLRDKKKDVEQAVKDLKGALLGMKFSLGAVIFGISLPRFLTGLGPIGIGLGVVALAGTKGGIQATDYIKSKRQSPYSYLLSLKGLKNETLLEAMLRGKIF